AHEQGGAAVGAAGTGTGTGGACSGMTCWQGVAGYAHYKPFDFVGVSLRGEFFHDDGVRLGAFAGVNANIAEGTGTLHFYLADGLETRLEFRHDYANQSVFTRGSGTTRRFQDTASAEVVYSF
ncbi:MAG: DUF3138 family protein, partial [Deltaproteobacteria bacterium]|nr:DUF3138 family protein [Deltaproteobacteria bacterium]